jgi:hypothetical protein
MIPLARVQFKEHVQAPGADLCIYPKPENVFVSVHCAGEPFQRSSTIDAKSSPKAIQRFELWLDGDWVVIQRPSADWAERYHVSQVQQCTELPARLRPAKAAKVA